MQEVAGSNPAKSTLKSGIVMIINIRVSPNSKVASLERISATDYVIKVREKATEGRANAAVIAAIAKYFGVSSRSVSIVRGAKNRKKVVEVVS